MSLFVNHPFASEPSIMLSSVEEDALLRVLQSAKDTQKSPSQAGEILRLDGIIYHHQTSWTIWINGRSIKPGQRVESLRIIKVTPYAVDLIWNPNSEAYHQVCLKPSEIFHSPSKVAKVEK